MAEFDFIGLPLKELDKIQEALKPLGYEIHGFKDKGRIKGGLLLYLTQHYSEPPIVGKT